MLHLYQTFRPAPAFHHEFPETVQVGPLWPEVRGRQGVAVTRKPSEWVWYASPASSARLLEEIDRGLRGTQVRNIAVRSSHSLPLPKDSPVRWTSLAPVNEAAWRGRFRRAGLRIVTGSRTLLEALGSGGPFLYFNGVMAEGRRRRRHRPEKIQDLLAAWRDEGVEVGLVRDLADFSRGRRVAEIVRRAASDPQWRSWFPRSSPVAGFPEGFEHAGRLLVRVANRFAAGRTSSDSIVQAVRSGDPFTDGDNSKPE